MSGVSVSPGTIRKHRNYDGTWEWQACLDIKENEKRRQVRKMTGVACDEKAKGERGAGRRVQATGKGARQAKKFLAEWRSQLVAELDKEREETGSQSMIVIDFMDYYWSTRSVEQTTIDGYAKLRKHIDHDTLRMRIGDLEPAHVQAWINAKLADGVGSPTVKKAFDQLKYACRWGVRMRLLDANPCEPITPPKKAHRDPNPLDEANTKMLSAKLGNLRGSGETQTCLADAASLAILTGMRLGELCGLGWDDIDGGADGSLKDGGLVHVNNVVVLPRGGAVIKPYPKNKERRDIPMNKEIVELLKSRRALFVKVEGNDLSGCYVFARPSSARSFMSPGYLGHSWNTFASMSGARGVQGLVPHFHDLRNTALSETPTFA